MRLALLSLLLVAPLATAGEIYRCDVDGVLTFTDFPCAEDAELHEPTGNLSVSGMSPEEVTRLTKQHQQYMESHREHAARERAAAREGRAHAPPTIQIIQPRPAILSAFGGFRAHHRPGPPFRADREDTRADERDERFSALSGRQPGARRRDR